jgi:hypothetical protein
MIRTEYNANGPRVEGESSRIHEKQLEGSRGRAGPEWAQAGRPSPFWAPFAAPFDQDDPRAIHSPPTKSHT